MIGAADVAKNPVSKIPRTSAFILIDLPRVNSYSHRIASCSSNSHSLFDGFILSSQRAISLPHLLHNRIVRCSETLNGWIILESPCRQLQLWFVGGSVVNLYMIYL